MKNRTKNRHVRGLGNRAGAKPRQCYQSWWCNTVTFGPRRGALKPKAERNFNAPDCIDIPTQARGRELSGLPMSVRLRHILDYGDCQVLGDLHGMRFSELEERRGCGERSLQELKALVRNVQLEVSRQSNPPATDAAMLK